MSRLTYLITFFICYFFLQSFSVAQDNSSSLHIDGTSRKIFYIQTNNVSENQNAVALYNRADDGTLSFVDFYKTDGTGINNDTHGKLGPQDNDSQIIVTEDKKYLYTVNIHSNTIAGFKIDMDGSLTKVPGSPFSSHGIAPVSINISGDVLMAANRNEDYHQEEELTDPKGASYTSFKINDDGSLVYVDKFAVGGFQKPAQIHASQTVKHLFFSNEFQVDADFDGKGERSVLAGPKKRVQGQIQAFKVDENGKINQVDKETLPETKKDYLYIGYPDVPSMPLGLWDHPLKNILYAGFVTRNQLGVYTYDESGELQFETAVENDGQDICWVLVNKEATRLYTVNNLPRSGTMQTTSTISVYDISGDKALNPEGIQITEVPMPGESFVNNRIIKQPGSTSFQIALSPKEDFVYIVNQRINQTEENEDQKGNFVHSFAVDADGKLSPVASKDLLTDGFPADSRAHGAVAIDLE